MRVEHPLHARSYREPADSPVHRLDVRVKLLCAVGLVVAVVSVGAEQPAAFLAYSILLLAVLALARTSPAYVLSRWLVILPFVLAAAVLPWIGPPPRVEIAGLSLSRHGLTTFYLVMVKSSLAVVAMSLLTASTHPGDLLAGLGRLGLPRTMVLIAGLAWRYLFVIGGEAMRMKRARDLRHYGGRWLWQAGVIGRMIGTLFIRSIERGERVHAAMLARGFDGTFRPGHPMTMSPADWAVLACWSAVLLAVRLLV